MEIVIYKKIVQLYDEKGDEITEGSSWYHNEEEKKEAINVAKKYCGKEFKIIDKTK